jgi:PelA/Pel-15E family pectate lyase
MLRLTTIIGFVLVVSVVCMTYASAADAENRDAFTRGLDHILAARYPTGGWPQSSPPGSGYHRHITFNDNAMVNLMSLV